MAIEKQGLYKIILWVVALCLIISAWWWILPSLVNRLFTFSVDAPGNLEREWQGEALVLPQGEAVLAPVAGKVTFLVRHGQWVAPGSIVAETIDSTGSPEVVYSPVGGLVDLAVMMPLKA